MTSIDINFKKGPCKRKHTKVLYAMVAIIHDMQQFHILFVAYFFTSIMICFKVIGYIFRGRNSVIFIFASHVIRVNLYRSRPSCSKLTTSLVNISLKFQKLFSQICQCFLLKKCEKLLQCIAKASLIFSTKNFSVFGYKFVKHLTS